MKKILFFLSMLSLAIGFVSCGDDDDNSQSSPAEDITLVSSSVAEGAEIDATLTSIALTYSAGVKAAGTPAVTLNGTAVKVSRGSSLKELKVEVALEPGTSYTLSVPAGAIVSTTDNSQAKAFTLHFTTKKSSPLSASLPDNDATRLTAKLGWGWNLGNHFDSFDGNNEASNYKITWSPNCPYWDNVNPTAELYTNLAKAGAKTVRIPVTWGPYMNMTDGKYTIDADYMAVVKKNVLWAKAAGLNVILNNHHDEYWLDAYKAGSNAAENESIKVRLTAMWKQIAEEFKNEGDYLILEAFNELNHNWASPRDFELNIQNEWNQLVVDVIRATGGQNATRWIAVPSYQASATYALDDRFKVPTDAANKIIVAVHNYDPYNFTLQNPLTEKWGSGCNSANDEKNVNDVLQKLCKKFILNNQPCYLGEYGCSIHTTALGEKCRAYYLEYFSRAAHFAGLSAILWDNNVTKAGAEAHGYFNHENGSIYSESSSIIPTMINALTSNDDSYSLESIKANAPK